MSRNAHVGARRITPGEMSDSELAAAIDEEIGRLAGFVDAVKLFSFREAGAGMDMVLDDVPDVAGAVERALRGRGTAVIFSRSSESAFRVLAAFGLLSGLAEVLVIERAFSPLADSLLGEMAARGGRALLLADGSGEMAGLFDFSGGRLSFRGFDGERIRLVAQYRAFVRLRLMSRICGCFAGFESWDEPHMSRLVSLFRSGLVLPREYRDGWRDRCLNTAAGVYCFQFESGEGPVDDEYARFEDATRVWMSVLPRVAGGEPGDGRTADEILDEMERLGRELGVDCLLDALDAGVPIGDVLAV